jgi:hemerythrin-like metal-binding protein
MPIYWKHDFELGHELIDKQHMRMVSLYNTLEETFYVQKNPIAVQSVFENLRDYIQYHMNMEEIIKNNIGIIEAENHYISHQILLRKIQKCYSRKTLSDEKFFKEVLEYFQGCLIDHLYLEKQNGFIHKSSGYGNSENYRI